MEKHTVENKFKKIIFGTLPVVALMFAGNANIANANIEPYDVKDTQITEQAEQTPSIEELELHQLEKKIEQGDYSQNVLFQLEYVKEALGSDEYDVRLEVLKGMLLKEKKRSKQKKLREDLM